MPTPVTKTDIINRFNAIVRNQLYYIGSAQAYYGYVPGIGDGNIINHHTLGPQAEPGKSAGDIPGVGAMASAVFNVLHGLAMEYTRVRQMRYMLATDAAPLQGGPYYTALKSYHALYFPIPGNQREPGTYVDSSDLDAFLYALRDAVNDRRQNSAYEHNIAACHASCHSSCHGSRGRR